MILPKIVNEHIQENNSFIEFNNLLKDRNFIVRDVRINDYGVDLQIEAILSVNDNKFASNYNCQVQLKSIKSSKNIRKKDMSLAYPIRLSNINYLRNFTPSMYVIYIEESNVFFWEWTSNIENAFMDSIEKCSDFKTKRSFRFHNVLDESSIEKIYGQTIMIGQRIRKMKDTICESSIIDYIDIPNVLLAFQNKYDVVKELVEAKKYKEAFNSFEKIVNLFEKPQQLIELSEIAILASMYEEASKYASRAIELEPKNSYAHYIRGLSFLEIKDYENAKVCFLESNDISFKMDNLYMLARMEIFTNNISEAIKYYTIISYYDKNNIDINLMLGEMYYSKLQFSKASFYFDKVLMIEPKNKLVLKRMGYLHLDIGSVSDSIYYFKQILGMDNNDKDSILGLLVCFYLNEDNDKFNYYLEVWKSLDKSDLYMNVLYIGWKESVIMLISENQEDISITKIENDTFKDKIIVDHIIVGVYDNKGYPLPFVGKIFMEEFRYINALDEIKNRTTFMQDAFSNNQSIDFDNKTKLLLREEKERIYMEINVNGYIISGNTNRGQKSAYKFFKEAYEKYGFFQVDLYNKETNDYIFYIVKGNVVFEEV